MQAMHSRVYSFLEETDLFFELQFGFRKQHSTSYALLINIEEIRHNLDKERFSFGVFVEIEKAFDTVNHKILLHYGIRDVANKWFA